MTIKLVIIFIRQIFLSYLLLIISFISGCTHIFIFYFIDYDVTITFLFDTQIVPVLATGSPLKQVPVHF